MIGKLKKILAGLRGEQNIDKLIARGLVVGKNLTRMGGVILDPSHCWHISIGDDVILAPNVHLLAHDASTKIFLNYTRVAKISIGNRVFIGAGTIILPGVEIGDDVVIGAGSVVSKSIPAGSVAVGSPARVISSLELYIEKQRSKMNTDNCFGEEYTLRNPEFSEQHRNEMIRSTELFDQIFVE